MKFNLANFNNSCGVERKKMASHLDSICREVGFILIYGHNIPDDIITAQWEAISVFFPNQMK